MKCSIMLYFIWVFAVNSLQKFSFMGFLSVNWLKIKKFQNLESKQYRDQARDRLLLKSSPLSDSLFPIFK